MKIEYDEAKNQHNIKTRNLDFDLAYEFDYNNAIEVTQVVDGEKRYFALGYIQKRLHALVYTLRGDKVRIISLRKANKREVKKYEQFN